MPRITDTYLKLKVICTELPGTRLKTLMVTIPRLKNLFISAYSVAKRLLNRFPQTVARSCFIPSSGLARNPMVRPNFLGPYAQGRPADRFFYLSWGYVVRNSGEFEMFRRLKIRLGHLDWAQVNRALESGDPIVVKLKLTDDLGGPLCATPCVSHITWVKEEI